MLNTTDVRQWLKYRISWPSLATTSITLAETSKARATGTGSRTSERFSTFTLVLRINFQSKADTVECGMEVGRVDARIISNQKPGSVLSSGLNGTNEESFGWAKPVACGCIWENLMPSSILCLLVDVLDIFLCRLRIKWILKSLRESGKFHSENSPTLLTLFELEFLRAVFHATELQFWNWHGIYWKEVVVGCVVLWSAAEPSQNRWGGRR